MSGADLFEDGFPHSTVAGYKRGCQGHACPGLLENGLSCAQAYARYQGDYGFRKKVDAGMSASEIIEAEKADAPKPKPSVKREERRPLAEFGDGFPEAHERAVTFEVDTDPAEEPVTYAVDSTDGIALELHGTTRGYSKGCRLRDKCPGIQTVGKSCSNAASDYQREYKARNRPAASVPPVEPESAEVAAEVVEPEIVAEAPAESQPSPEPEPLAIDYSAMLLSAELHVAELMEENEDLRKRYGHVESNYLNRAEKCDELEAENQKLLSLTGEQTDTILGLRAQLMPLQAAEYDNAHSASSEPVVDVRSDGSRQISITVTIGGAA